MKRQHDARMLIHQQAKAFYERLGAGQVLQAFYEAPATGDLIAYAAFETAQFVSEFGCGTGAFVERFLSHHLPQHATYLTVDSSSTMVGLARARLTYFGERVEVRQLGRVLLTELWNAPQLPSLDHHEYRFGGQGDAAGRSVCQVPDGF